MKIRKPTTGDHDKLVELTRDFWEYNFDKGGITPEIAPFEEDVDREQEIQSYVTELLEEKNYFGLVAEEDSRLVGFIFGSLKAREGYKLDKEGFVEEFFVTDGRRGQGVGTQLFEVLVQEFKSRGATHLALDAYVANKPAIDLYHKWGFVDSELVMRRKLDV